jgi:hypothetical protein
MKRQNNSKPTKERRTLRVSEPVMAGERSRRGSRRSIVCDIRPARNFQWPSISLSVSHHNVLCLSPHSLHVYGTRICPGAAETRFGAPHFPHFVSMRVCPCLTATVFRSNASFTKRSVSSRIACFDISRLLLLSRSEPSPQRRSSRYSTSGDRLGEIEQIRAA